MESEALTLKTNETEETKKRFLIMNEFQFKKTEKLITFQIVSNE